MTTTEKRIVASRPIIGTRPAPAPVEETGKKGKKDPEGRRKPPLLLIIGIVVVLLGGGAAYWFLMGPGASAASETTATAAPTEPEAPEPGEVEQLEPVSLNLADGHYLRIGIALQLTADAHALDKAKAVDLVLTHYSGRTVEEVSAAQTREALRAELATKLSEAYDGEVMGVYLTDYVTQ